MEYTTLTFVEQWITVTTAGIRGNRYITRMGLSSALAVALAVADSVERS